MTFDQVERHHCQDPLKLKETKKSLADHLEKGEYKIEREQFLKRNFIMKSYEETLFRGHFNDVKSIFVAELIISKTFKDVPLVVKKLRFPVISGIPFPKEPQCPWCGRIVLTDPLTIPRKSFLQIVLCGDPNVVGKIFFLSIDSTELSRGSSMIIRQKHYNNNALEIGENLQHGVQILLTKRLVESNRCSLDSNGNFQYNENARKTEKVQIHGSIRLIFSWNQAATIGKSLPSNDNSFMKESALRIITSSETFNS